MLFSQMWNILYSPYLFWACTTSHPRSFFVPLQHDPDQLTTRKTRGQKRSPRSYWAMLFGQFKSISTFSSRHPHLNELKEDSCCHFPIPWHLPASQRLAESKSWILFFRFPPLCECISKASYPPRKMTTVSLEGTKVSQDFINVKW